MGAAEPAVGEQQDENSSGIRQHKIFAQNTGICMEERYPDGAVLLSLGAGRVNWNGWVSVDLKDADVKTDLRKLPFPDDYADAAAAVHVVEHFYAWEAVDIIKEWRRVLKPGGKLILELPCMDKVFYYIKAAIESGKPLSATFCNHALWGDPKYKSVEMCHKWGYTVNGMKAVLSMAGFTEFALEEAKYHFPQRDMRFVATK